MHTTQRYAQALSRVAYRCISRTCHAEILQKDMSYVEARAVMSLDDCLVMSCLPHDDCISGNLGHRHRYAYG